MQRELARIFVRCIIQSMLVGRAVAAVRAAFEVMPRDRAFVEMARCEHSNVDPGYGEAMQTLLAEIVAMPKVRASG